MLAYYIKLIMSFVSEYLTPFLDFYHRLLDGDYLSSQLPFKGSQEVGGDYVNKVRRTHRRSITQKYDDALASVSNPNLATFVGDNLPRLLLNRNLSLTQRSSD
jgi:hypothetical protein